LRGTVALARFGWATGLNELNPLCSLTLRSKLDFEGDSLIQLRATGATGPGGHMYEYRLATLGGIDTSEAPVVVPGGEGAFKAHERCDALCEA
jgi:hypothetical protein